MMAKMNDLSTPLETEMSSMADLMFASSWSELSCWLKALEQEDSRMR